jgi:hypothetical protein
MPWLRACNFQLCAPNVRDERARRKGRTKSVDLVENRQYRRRQNDQIAPANCVGRIGVPRINSAALLRTLGHRCAIAADHASHEAALFQREAQRSANQARPDDGDLLESHGEFVIAIGNL